MYMMLVCIEMVCIKISLFTTSRCYMVFQSRRMVVLVVKFKISMSYAMIK